VDSCIISTGRCVDTYFTKLDLTEGYHQIQLEEESRHITTFATYLGLFRHKRLIFGISSAFELFQKQIEIVIRDCPKTKNISDDILVWATLWKSRTLILKMLSLKSQQKNEDQGTCIFAAYHLPSIDTSSHPMASLKRNDCSTSNG